jgi:hypothetical protein
MFGGEFWRQKQAKMDSTHRKPFTQERPNGSVRLPQLVAETGERSSRKPPGTVQ